MTIDEKYMRRCLQLALNGKGYVSPNPMVGAVVVCNGKIIGEGFHVAYGQPHAEVNAINSVKDKSLLRNSTIYVSLEPCSHYGKTPPCAKLIIDSGIPRVVIACLDPFPEVSGRGVKMLKDAGVEVAVGILQDKAEKLNKEFMTSQVKKRPYVYLKWAQSGDGFIDAKRHDGSDGEPVRISNDFSMMLVHKLRAEVSAIMVGTNTAIMDNPSLTTRYWAGKNPTRIVINRENKIPKDYKIFDGEVETLVFTESNIHENGNSNVTYIQVPFGDSFLDEVFKKLNERKIDSVLIEGGRYLLQSIIDKNLWDEAYIETAHITLGDGVNAPTIKGRLIKEVSGAKYVHTHLSLH